MREEVVFVAYDDAIPADIAENERNLMRAILRCAIEDLTKDGKAKRDALNFFLSHDEFYIYSFTSICDQLSISRDRMLRLVGLNK